MSKKKNTNLDDINDILIVQKIKERDPTRITSNINTTEATQCLCFTSICDCKRNLYIEEQEAQIKKQLWISQADERGKQALLSEIASLKHKQEQRDELLRNRQYALDIERERSRKIVSLPPPLPKSVKLLLKINDNESKSAKPDVQMPDELTAVTIKPVQLHCENKENIVDSEEMEGKRKMQEEWQTKAKKRFNEALKKNRQKEEYSNIMKQIQNAELLNRREMAKNISSEKKGMPCLLSDKFQIAKKQTDMEENAEKLFKKTGNKEHVIEDIEGYQDHYEEKYKKIDSSFEAKMIDCVPNFLKENYEYLLANEPEFHVKRRFSGLDDSCSDILNKGYLEIPPDSDEPDGREKIDLAISHLDKVRSSIQEEYEHTLKPLLLATAEIPKKESKDIAVETEPILEDKAVGTDVQFKVELTSPSPPPAFDYQRAGVMAYKRRPQGVHLSSFRSIPSMHKRDVHYIVPSATHSEDLGTASWSSSSYCSLPSKHSIPIFSNSSESVKCDICVAEMEKNSVKDFPNEPFSRTTTFAKEKSDGSDTSTEKAMLSEYVQKLAKKYLVTKSSSKCTSKESTIEPLSDSDLPMQLSTETISPAFEKEVIGKSKPGLFVDHQKSEESDTGVTSQGKELSHSSSIIFENAAKVVKLEKKLTSDFGETQSEHLKDDIYKIRNSESCKIPGNYQDPDLETHSIQAIQQVLLRRMPRFTLDSSPQLVENKDEKEPEKIPISLQAVNEIGVKPHVYHELSTIQELDSALTAGSLQFSLSKSSDMSGTTEKKEVLPQDRSKEDAVQSADKLKITSLLDLPNSHISELAKHIHFVPEEEEKTSHLIEPKIIRSQNVNVVSKGSLSTPSSISSFDSNSISSIFSSPKIFSSTLTRNHVNNPYLKDVKALPNFKDISDIQKKVSGSDTSVSLSTIPHTEFLSCTPVSISGQSVPYMAGTKSKENIDNQPSIISGYISDLDVPEMSKCDIIHSTQEKKDTLISGYISDLETPEMTDSNTPSSSQEKKHSIISGYIEDLEVSKITQSDILSPNQEKKDTMHSIISGYITDLEAPQLTESDSPSSIQDRNSVDCVISGYISAVAVPEMIHSDSYSCSEDNKHDMNPISKYVGEVQGKTKTNISHTYQEQAREFDEKKMKICAKNYLLKNSQDTKLPSSSADLKPVTPHSNASSPNKLADISLTSKHQDFEINKNFQPLTPCSNDISSPNESAYLPIAHIHEDFRHAKNFQPLTPCLDDISSPGESAYLPLGHIEQDFKHSNRFNLKMPQFNEPSFGEYGYPSSSKSLKAPDEVELRQNISPENSEFHPMVVKLDISTNSLSSGDTNDELIKGMKVPQLHYNFALKTHLSKPTNYTLFEKPAQKPIIGVANEKIHFVDDSKSNVQLKLNGLQKSKLKPDVYACSSDFFVPSVPKENINEYDLIKSISEQKESATKPTSSAGKETITTVKEMPLADKVNIMKQKSAELEMADKECWILQTVPSTSSSTDNLSEISSSKVVYQSTPIKSLTEIMQEPGILEEPDLTLFATTLNSKIDLSEMFKNTLTNSPVKEHRTEDKDIILSSSQSECRTPSYQSPQILGSVDTPSLRSFLRHEMSCIETENDDGETNNVTPNTFESLAAQEKVYSAAENKIPQCKEGKRFPFQKTDYKDRTKRLWNNLEEVKKRNYEKERRRLIEINRQKAKEYAKKLTPKQKSK